MNDVSILQRARSTRGAIGGRRRARETERIFEGDRRGPVEFDFSSREEHRRSLTKFGEDGAVMRDAVVKSF